MDFNNWKWSISRSVFDRIKLSHTGEILVAKGTGEITNPPWIPDYRMRFKLIKDDIEMSFDYPESVMTISTSPYLFDYCFHLNKLLASLISSSFEVIDLDNHVFHIKNTSSIPLQKSELFNRTILHIEELLGQDISKDVKVVQRYKGYENSSNLDNLLYYLYPDCGASSSYDTREINIEHSIGVEDNSGNQVELGEQVLITSAVVCDYRYAFTLRPLEAIINAYIDKDRKVLRIIFNSKHNLTVVDNLTVSSDLVGRLFFVDTIAIDYATVEIDVTDYLELVDKNTEFFDTLTISITKGIDRFNNCYYANYRYNVHFLPETYICAYIDDNLENLLSLVVGRNAKFTSSSDDGYTALLYYEDFYNTDILEFWSIPKDITDSVLVDVRSYSDGVLKHSVTENLLYMNDKKYLPTYRDNSNKSFVFNTYYKNIFSDNSVKYEVDIYRHRSNPICKEITIYETFVRMGGLPIKTYINYSVKKLVGIDIYSVSSISFSFIENVQDYVIAIVIDGVIVRSMDEYLYRSDDVSDIITYSIEELTELFPDKDFDKRGTLTFNIEVWCIFNNRLTKKVKDYKVFNKAGEESVEIEYAQECLQILRTYGFRFEAYRDTRWIKEYVIEFLNINFRIPILNLVNGSVVDTINSSRFKGSLSTFSNTFYEYAQETFHNMMLTKMILLVKVGVKKPIEKIELVEHLNIYGFIGKTNGSTLESTTDFSQLRYDPITPSGVDKAIVMLNNGTILKSSSDDIFVPVVWNSPSAGISFEGKVIRTSTFDYEPKDVIETFPRSSEFVD